MNDGLLLLRSIAERRTPELVEKLKLPLNLSDQEKFSIRQALTDELCDSGLNQDDEPNEVGLQIEHLIDLLGHDSPEF